MELIDLIPNAMSFRVITTIDIEDEAEIPVDFTGRVRRHAGGSVSYVAWYRDGQLHNPGRQYPAYRRHRPDGKLKYELDKDTGMFKLDRVLYSAVHYPGDYGFIPRTLHEDNDPLDIIVRIDEPTFPGCQIACRPIGVLKMLDRGEPDDKILAVPSQDPLGVEYYDIADVPRHYLAEIEHFFQIYKDLEGKRVQIVGWEKSEVAMQVIMESIDRYAALHRPATT